MIPFLIGLAVFALTTYAHYDSRGRVGGWDVVFYALFGCGIWLVAFVFLHMGPCAISKLWSLL